jgi:hypothetical protein
MTEKLSPEAQTVLDSIEQADAYMLMSSGSAEFPFLMNRAIAVFESVSAADAALAYACLFGMLVGEIEGKRLDGGKFTVEERLIIHNAIVRKIAAEAAVDAAMDGVSGTVN